MQINMQFIMKIQIIMQICKYEDYANNFKNKSTPPNLNLTLSSMFKMNMNMNREDIKIKEEVVKVT